MEDSIIVYSSPTCPRCKMLKMELSKKGISFQSCEDEEEVLRVVGPEIPVLYAEGRYMKFKEAIDWVKRLN